MPDENNTVTETKKKRSGAKKARPTFLIYQIVDGVLSIEAVTKSAADVVKIMQEEGGLNKVVELPAVTK